MEVPAKLQDFEFAKKFWNLATELLASKQFIVHPVEDGSGGLEGVLGGLNKLEEGRSVVSSLCTELLVRRPDQEVSNGQ